MVLRQHYFMHPLIMVGTIKINPELARDLYDLSCYFSTFERIFSVLIKFLPTAELFTLGGGGFFAKVKLGTGTV